MFRGPNMRVCALQSVSFEGPGTLRAWCQERGHEFQARDLSAGAGLPSPDELDLLVLLGGPMGVGDGGRFPWLEAQRDLALRSLQHGRQVLGVCLGAQLLAAALGATVAPMGHQEIGWFPLDLEGGPAAKHWLEPLAGADVFHWHGDAFQIPAGAVRLAASAACPNQAFAVGRLALGLQFHVEVDAAAIEAMLAHGEKELASGGAWVQTPQQLRGDGLRLLDLRRRSFALLDRFVAA